MDKSPSLCLEKFLNIETGPTELSWVACFDTIWVPDHVEFLAF